MEKVSEKIKAGRQAKGVTIEELSQATLISTTIIKDIEAGAFDKFTGDEQYVKMYLKKIARYLDIDASIADEYIALTQELKLEDLQKQKEKEKEEQDKKGGTTFVDKMSDTFKNMQAPKPEPVHRKKGVYEDHYILRFVKYGIVAILVVAIIAVIWFAVLSTKQNDTSTFNKSNDTTVEGNVTTKKAKKKTTKKDTQTKQKTDTTDQIVQITKTASMNYDFKLPEGAQTFKVKFEFVGRSWASLQVNGADYSEFESRIYNSNNTSNSMNADPETVELTFNVADFQNLNLKLGFNRGHRFYINDQQIPLEDSDYTSNNAQLKLNLVK